MTTTYQTNLTDTTYNGWAEHGYKSLSHMLIEMSPETPDGVKWDDDKLNVIELNEMLEEF